MPEQSSSNHDQTLIHNDALSDSANRSLNTSRVVLQALLEIEKSVSENEIFDAIGAVMAESPFVCAVFDVHPGAIRLLKLIDRSFQGGKSSSKDVTIEIPGSIEDNVPNQYIILDNLHPNETYHKLLNFFKNIGCRSAVVFPIHIGQDPVNLVAFGSLVPEVPTEFDVFPYTCLAKSIGWALARIRDRRNLESQLANLETIGEISESISSETEIFTLYQRLHHKLTARLGEDLSFAVAIYHPATNEIHIPYLFETGKVTSLDPFPLGEGLTSLLIQSKKSLMLVKNTEQEARRLGAKVVGKTAKSWLGVPLLTPGQAVGAIIVQDTEQEGRFTEKDRLFLESAAPQVAIAVRNAQLLDEMTVTLHKYDHERFLLNSLLENIPEKVYFKDLDGKYIRTSRSWLDQLRGEHPDGINGLTDLELFPGEEGIELHDRDMEVSILNSPSIGIIEEKIHPGGEKTWEWTSRIPLTDKSGKTIGLLGLSQDISMVKKAEILSQRRAQQLQTASEIARDTTGTLDTAQILNNVVNLVRDRFEFYHASVFLVDSTHKYAVLQEASGKTGEMMKKIGHRLAIGSSSLVGQAVAKGSAVVVNDIKAHQDYYPNPLLPETRSEVVVPIKIGARVLGALDVQSDKLDAFHPEDIHTLEILADQLAIALENASLYNKTQEQFAKQKLLRQLTTAVSTAADLEEALQKIVASLHETLGNNRVAIYFSAGQDTLEIRAHAGYRFDAQPRQAINLHEGLIGEAARKRQPVFEQDIDKGSSPDPEQHDTRSSLAVPIIYLDDLFGVLILESSQVNAYDENDLEMMGSLGDSLAVIIANIRLLLQIRDQMEMQQKLFDISGKIRHSVDVDAILRTTAQEIGQTLGFSEVIVELFSPDGQESLESPSEVS